MRLFLGKLGFIHRRLWERDGWYRAALLFGPAPLLGCALATGIWLLVRPSPAPSVQPPPWGKPPASSDNWSTTGDPHKVEPALPIPRADARGRLSGYEPGWRGTIHALEVSPTFNTQIDPESLDVFFVDGATIDLAPIIAAGPKNGKFVGTGSAYLVIKTPGIYALSLRFERASGPKADCLTRLIFGARKVVASFNVGNPGDVSRTYDPARFDLEPGLYPLGWVFGCWRDEMTVGPGRITVLIGHPGDPALQPAAPEEIVRPEASAQASSSAPTDRKPPPPMSARGAPGVDATVDPASGLPRALLGRTFQSSLVVAGFNVPLPPGDWALLVQGTLTGTEHPENKGNVYFLGQIVHKRLVAAMWVQGMRSPGLGFVQNQNCTNPNNLYVLDESAGTSGQGCTWIRAFFSADMQQWADKSAHIDQMARAAGANLATKGVSYPQELLTVGFHEAEKWGQLTAGYLFSPEKEGISSSKVPALHDSDWYKANLQRYPEKIAYVQKLQRWAENFAPKFHAAFAAGKQETNEETTHGQSSKQ
jgi:hypothetical protein